MFGIGIPELIIIALILIIIAAPVIIVIVLLSRRSVDSSIKSIYCTKCGKQNDGNALNCVECGSILQQPQQYGAGAPTGAGVPNYLVQSILVTIFCCLPFGIPAIVFAAQVNGKLAAGDHAGAVDASNKAKMWCWISFGVGLAFLVIWLFGVLLAPLIGR